MRLRGLCALVVLACASASLTNWQTVDTLEIDDHDDFELFLEVNSPAASARLPSSSLGKSGGLNSDKLFDNLDAITDPKSKTLVLPLPEDKYTTVMVLASSVDTINLDNFEEALGKVLKIHPERIKADDVKKNGDQETSVTFEIMNNSTFSEISAAEAQQLLSELVSHAPDMLADALGAPVIGVTHLQGEHQTKAALITHLKDPDSAKGNSRRSGMFGPFKIKVFKKKKLTPINHRLPVTRRPFYSEPGASWVSFWDKTPVKDSYKSNLRCESVCGLPPPPGAVSFFQVDQTSCVLNGGEYRHTDSTCLPFMTPTSNSFAAAKILSENSVCSDEFGAQYAMCDVLQGLSLASLNRITTPSLKKMTSGKNEGATAWVRGWTEATTTAKPLLKKITSLVPKCLDNSKEHLAVTFGAATGTDHAVCLGEAVRAAALCCRSAGSSSNM